MATVKPGDTFRVESKEWFDGTIVDSDDADDVRDCDTSIVHQLSGPFAVEGAGLGPEGVRAVWGGTARRFYRLAP